jgi:hypothetical protein
MGVTKWLTRERAVCSKPSAQSRLLKAVCSKPSAQSRLLGIGLHDVMYSDELLYATFDRYSQQ